MRTITSFFVSAAMLATASLTARAEINVVASIKPLHSLVAGVMKDVAKPRLIIEGAGSPHTYAMKPSQALVLEKADLVVWIGPRLEAFLEKPLKTLASKAKSIELLDIEGLVKLDKRKGGAFEGHKHHKGKKDDHAAKHDDQEKHHDDHHDKHLKMDSHVWLDPVNAKAIVREIEKALAELDPSNAPTYKRNAATMIKLLDALIVEVASQVGPPKGKGFIVFHDAYQYFEKRFGLNAAGSITVLPEVMPGAKRVGELRAKVKELGVACVFSEPQFEPKLVATVTEGTSAKSGVLDPHGAALEDGPSLYFTLIRNMATSFTTCLSKAG